MTQYYPCYLASLPRLCGPRPGPRPPSRPGEDHGDEKKSGIRANGWSFTLKTGAYGLEYLRRAYITAMDLGANRPQDMVFPMAPWDENARPLDGANDMCCLSPGENSSGHGVLVADNVQL